MSSTLNEFDHLRREIDNPGAGHCGFYALAIGLIEKACVKGQVEILQRWLKLDPDVAPALEAFIKQSNDKPFSKVCIKPYLDPLKNSLKKILQTKVLEELDTYKQRPVNYLDSKNYFFLKFTELLENIDTRAINLNINPLYGNREIQYVCKAINHYLSAIQNPYVQDQVKNALFNLVIQQQFSLFEGQLKKQYAPNYPWYATDEELKLLAECFEQELNIFTNSRLVNGRVGENSILLHNRRNVHWTTYIYPPDFDVRRLNVNQDKLMISGTRVGDLTKNLDLFRDSRKKLSQSLVDSILFNDFRFSQLLDVYERISEALISAESEPDGSESGVRDILIIKKDSLSRFIEFFKQYQKFQEEKGKLEPELAQILQQGLDRELEFYRQNFSLIQDSNDFATLKAQDSLLLELKNGLGRPLIEYYAPKFSGQLERERTRSSLFGWFFNPKPALSPFIPSVASSVPAVKNNKSSNYSKFCLLGGGVVGAITAEACIQFVPNLINNVASGLMSSPIGAHLILLCALILVGLILGRIAQFLLEPKDSLNPTSP